MRILAESDRLADRAAISRTLSGRTALSADQVAVLVAEIAGSDYKGKTAAEVVVLINASVLVDNPVDVTQVRSTTTIGALKEWWRPLLYAVSLTDQTKYKKWFATSSAYLAQYTDSYAVEYDAATFLDLRLGVVADKIVTQADLDALMPLVNDPIYSPKLWESAAERLFGAGAFVDDADLEGLL